VPVLVPVPVPVTVCVRERERERERTEGLLMTSSGSREGTLRSARSDLAHLSSVLPPVCKLI
jgi:hypothetical protein